MSADAPVLSVVIPLLNEEEVLEQTYAELKRHLGVLQDTYEIVFIDDGSTDRSRAILAAKSLDDPTVRVSATHSSFHIRASETRVRTSTARASVPIY